MKKTRAIALTISLFMCAAFAEDAASIIDKSVTRDRPDFSKTQITLEIMDKSGNVEKRTMNQYGNHRNGNTQSVFDFKTPASVKDTRILQTERENGSDIKHIYLPSLRTVRQIATAERKKDFVGTDYTYNDMTLRHASDDDNQMMDENASKRAGDKTYSVWKIKSTPVANKNVEFSYRILYVDKDSYIPVVTEFYDKTDKLLKSITVEKLEKVTGATGKSYWLRRVQLSENKITNHSTRIIVNSFEFDKPISDNYFTQNFLATGK